MSAFVRSEKGSGSWHASIVAVWPPKMGIGVRASFFGDSFE
jgi:hypothetical protein